MYYHRKSPDEPVFVLTTPTSVQAWTLNEYKEYLAVEHGWGKRLHVRPFDLQVLMPEESMPRRFTVMTAPATGGEAEVEGVLFTDVFATVLGSPLREGESNTPAYTFQCWLPDLGRSSSFARSSYPWRWMAYGMLVIGLQVPIL